MNKKVVTGLISVVGLFAIVCAVIFINNGDKKESGSGSNDNEMVGKYKLTAYKTGNTVYKSDEVKGVLGRTITLEITKEYFILKSTYYSTDGQSSTVDEKFTYDKESLYDESDKTFKVYDYMFSEGELAIVNKDEDSMMEFSKN
jgi:hypothetical protein